MSGLSDILKFEGFNLKEIARKIKKDPERLLIGGIDPASTKLNNTLLGRDDEPLVDQWGGASSDTYGKAEAAGINTKPGKSMHRLARAIAGSIAGGYGLSQLGGSAAAGAGNGGPQQAGTSEGGLSAMDKIRVLQSIMPNPQQQQPTRLEDVAYEAPDMEGYLATTMPSSRDLKTPRRGLGDAIDRGVRSEDPIDSNGVEVAAIKELDGRITRIVDRIQKLKGKKA